MHLIGLDIGTTGCKAIVFDDRGSLLGRGFQEYGIICSEPGMAEQDAEQVWLLARRALGQAIAEAQVKEVAALSISVQGDAIIAVDSGLKALYPAILGMDYRSQPQAQRCEEQFGAFELFQRTGMRPHPMNSIVKALWLRENRPKTFATARRILTYADFILSKLGAEPVIDFSMASRTMALDLVSRTWSSDMLESLNLDAGLLSKPVPSGQAVGLMAPQLASELGLKGKVLVVTGAHDQVCAAIGAGMVREHLGVISTGTAEVLSTAFNAPTLTREMLDGFYPCYLHAKQGMYFTFALNHVGGILLRWYRDNFAQAEVAEAAELGRDAYELIDARMPPGPSGLMLVPHWNGSGTPFCDVHAQGIIVGWTMASTRHHLAKAILEGLAFELLINLETMLRSGINVNQFVAVGGGAKSPLWLQIKADILDRPIRTLRCGEAACLGAALLAGVAAGAYASLDEATDATVRSGREFTPDAGMVPRYREQFAEYRRLYAAFKQCRTNGQ